MRAVRCRQRLVDFLGNSGLVYQTDRLEDKQQSELEGLGKRYLKRYLEMSKNGFCRQPLIYKQFSDLLEKYSFILMLCSDFHFSKIHCLASYRSFLGFRTYRPHLNFAFAVLHQIYSQGRNSCPRLPVLVFSFNSIMSLSR